MTLQSAELRQRVHAVTVRAAQLEGVRRAAQEQNTQLTSEVALAKGRNALADEVARVFDAMQQRAHERSVGSLEGLLSAILEDVMPGEGKVRLLPQYKANSTHLDINLEKNGGLEDIYEGNGGALTNVVCAGLRFASLARTGNRRALVLDEPDCWLKPSRVPAFVRTISEVAQQAGVQVFYISHHDWEFFDGYFNLVSFFTDEADKVCAKPLLPLVCDWSDDQQPGIRRIELVNVRRHEHTVVPCYPHANAFIGENNLGKSTALGAAFKAVAYGESDDSIIRRGCDEAQIVIHLENKTRVEWSRKPKRSPVVLYRLYVDDELVGEGGPKSRNEAPDWVTKVLGMCRVDDLDIQVGSQKSPVFLLNDSAPKRAQILSVGREASYLKDLMKGYEEVKGQDREVVKQGEMKLAKLKLRLGYLEKLPAAQELVAKLQQGAEALIKAMESKEQLQTVLRRLEQASANVAAMELETAALAELPEAPQMHDFKDLQRVIQALERGQHLSAVGELPQLPEIPQLHDLSDLVRLGAAISKADRLAKLELPPTLPELPQLHDVAALGTRVESLAKLLAAVVECEKEESAATRSTQEAEAELARVKEELGECPLCGTPFVHEHGAEHVH